jgi:hypothetical protein
MEVINKRSAFNAGYDIDIAMAEIVISEEGKTVFLYGEWSSESGPDIVFSASTESRYDYEEGLLTDESITIQEAQAERKRLRQTVASDDQRRYASQFIPLMKRVLAAEIMSHGRKNPFGII